MELCFVRHGQTKGNTKHILQGHSHGDLTKKGIIQAKCIGDRLSEEHFDYVYCSDLGRAAHTFKHILLRNKSLLYQLNFETSSMNYSSLKTPHSNSIDYDFQTDHSYALNPHKTSPTHYSQNYYTLKTEDSQVKTILKNKEDAVF